MLIKTNDAKLKNYNSTLTNKHQKYLHHHQVIMINMNIFQVKKQYHLIKVEL